MKKRTKKVYMKTNYKRHLAGVKTVNCTATGRRDIQQNNTPLDRIFAFVPQHYNSLLLILNL